MSEQVTPRHAPFARLLPLRFSLAAVFLWFGALKLAGASPALGLIRSAFPFLAASPFVELLGLAEIAIGLGLLTRRGAHLAALAMTAHLCATLLVAALAPARIFAPAFPGLSLEGEFLAKNLVLFAAGLALLDARSARPAARRERPVAVATREPSLPLTQTSAS
jgi:putative oxidoreductase